MKKGFTLIELLAVIVILAVIALIVTPVITGIIDDARTESNKRSAESYVEAADLYYAQSTLKQDMQEKYDDNIIDDLNVKGQKAEGYVTVDQNGKTELAIKLDNKCYKKTKAQNVNEITVTEEEDCNVNSLAVVPPDRCFDYADASTKDSFREMNITSGIVITNYKCGNTISGNYDMENLIYPEKNIKMDGEFTNIKLPAKINNLDVVGVDAVAFSPFHEILKDDTVENGSPFSGKVGLTNLIIPQNIKMISTYAFLVNTIRSITIEGDREFASNSYSFGTNDNHLYLGMECFINNEVKGKDAVISLKIDAGDANFKVLAAYAGPKVDTLEIPEGINLIMDSSLMFVAAKEIKVPNSVGTIVAGAFGYMYGLEKVTIDNSSGALSGAPWGAPSTVQIQYLR